MRQPLRALRVPVSLSLRPPSELRGLARLGKILARPCAYHRFLSFAKLFVFWSEPLRASMKPLRSGGTILNFMILLSKPLRASTKSLRRRRARPSPNCEGLARFEEILAQPCAYAFGIFLGRIFQVEFFLTKIL